MRFRLPPLIASVLSAALLGAGCTEHPFSLDQGELETQAAAGKHDDGPGWVVSSISAGDGYACAIEPDRQAYCWGSSVGGALGDGLLTSTRLTPTPVVGGHEFVSITTYRFDAHTCALTPEGKAYCWGANDWGQLGDGTTTRRLEPTPVAGDHVFDSIAVAGTHTCALERDGDAYCWGSNGDGELGIGTYDDEYRSVPTPVVGGHQFVRIDAVNGGIPRTCALTVGGEAYCWGFEDNTQAIDVEPRLMPGGPYAHFGPGLGHHCGISVEGDTYCWGDTLDNGVTEPTLVGGGHRFIALGDLNRAHLALDELGDVYGWGPARGDISGWGPESYLPTRKTSGFGFVTFSGGQRRWGTLAGALNEHLCAIDGDGIAYCWGDNESGQLGDGTTTQRSTPGRVRQPGSSPARPVRAEPVTDLAVESATSTSLTLYWTEVDDGLGEPAWYRVKYAESPLADWKTATIGCHRAIRGEEIGSEIWCTVEDLAPEKVYELQLMSHRLENGVWQGAVYSNVATGETFPAGVPTTVDDLEVVDATASALTLRWTQVNDGRGEPAWYRVRYGSPLGDWKDGALGCDRSIEGTEIGAEMSCVVEGLAAGTDYDLQLYSYYYRDGKWAAARASNRTSGTTSGAGSPG